MSLALLYPRPYVAHVEETARAAGVSSGLLYAMMRRESAFQPDRRSAARARARRLMPRRTRMVVTPSPV